MEKKKERMLHVEWPKTRGHLTPCHYYLQKCHYELQNYKNDTLGLKCWPIHSDDVEMMWQRCDDSLQLNINVQTPKFALPKYLKIIKNKN